jgi:anaerobic selenocysteine-containing dehydrogenase
MNKRKHSIIERIAETLRIIPNLHKEEEAPEKRLAEAGDLTKFPPPEKWDNWVEYEAKSWPRLEKKNYMIVPTTCFNCESACGLTAYIDKATMQVRKFEGNPYHPGSRGRNCAKGPATINQLTDPDRILYPLKRVGKRGAGKWERVSWDEVLDDIAGRLAKPSRKDATTRSPTTWGAPATKATWTACCRPGTWTATTATPISAPPARASAMPSGTATTAHRPMPRQCFILLISAHFESGHYFNPHAQRIIEGKMKGAKLAVIDPRLSNTASMADYWMPTYPVPRLRIAGHGQNPRRRAVQPRVHGKLGELGRVPRGPPSRQGAHFRELHREAMREEYAEYTP